MFAFDDKGVLTHALVRGEPRNSGPRNLASKKPGSSLYSTVLIFLQMIVSFCRNRRVWMVSYALKHNQTGQRAVMLWGWKGDRKSSDALAMCDKLWDLFTYGLKAHVNKMSTSPTLSIVHGQALPFHREKSICPTLVRPSVKRVA